MYSVPLNLFVAFTICVFQEEPASVAQSDACLTGYQEVMDLIHTRSGNTFLLWLVKTDLQCQAARHSHHQVQWATCAAWHWGSGPHSEKTPIVQTCGMLQWYSEDSLWHTVDGKHGSGRPKMTWKQLTERGCREWKLSAINPHDRHTWRSGVRSAMPAARQLSGRGPTDVDVAPVSAH